MKNLMVSRVEYRDEDDEEIQQHTHNRQVTRVAVEREALLDQCQQMVHSIMRRTIKPLIQARVRHMYSYNTLGSNSSVCACVHSITCQLCYTLTISHISKIIQITKSIVNYSCSPLLNSLCQLQLFYNNDVERITRYSLVLASQRSREGFQSDKYGRFQKVFQQVSTIQRKVELVLLNLF